MTTSLWEIRRRRRRDPLALASADDFRRRRIRQGEAREALGNPRVSLYCLDAQGGAAWFVETEREIVADNPPFFYQAQFERAIRLYSVSFDELRDAVAPGGQPPLKLTLIYSVGRCGSTWLGRVLHASGACHCLSEPDVYTQLVALGLDEALSRQWLALATPLLCRTAEDASLGWCIKFRSMAIEHAHLMAELFPHARMLFLYRNLADYVRSAMQAFRYPGSPLWMFDTLRKRPVLRMAMRAILKRRQAALARMAPLAADYSPAELVDLGPAGLLGLAWLSCMRRYLALREQAPHLAAVRYEDLLADPHGALGAALRFAGLPVDHLPQALQASRDDAQRGSVVARERRCDWQFDPQSQAVIDELLRCDPQIHDGAVILPGTLSP